MYLTQKVYQYKYKILIFKSQSILINIDKVLTVYTYFAIIYGGIYHRPTVKNELLKTFPLREDLVWKQELFLLLHPYL